MMGAEISIGHSYVRGGGHARRAEFSRRLLGPTLQSKTAATKSPGFMTRELNLICVRRSQFPARLEYRDYILAIMRRI